MCLVRKKERKKERKKDSKWETDKQAAREREREYKGSRSSLMKRKESKTWHEYIMDIKDMFKIMCWRILPIRLSSIHQYDIVYIVDVGKVEVTKEK